MRWPPGVALFEVGNLSDVIVLAGPNGVGKTRLTQALTNAFRNPTGYPNVQVVVDATCDYERKLWGKNRLDTTIQQDAQLLAKTIQRNRKRSEWESSLYQFESDRSSPVYNAFGFTWDAIDPWEELISWDSSLSGLRGRYQDTIASLFRKVHNLNDAIAKKGRELIAQGGGRIDPKDFPDPMEPFKLAFQQLLAPKELVSPDPKDQTLYYMFEGAKHPISSLSSGEREVVNIVFDFLLHDPSDCIVIFDEPELHLHPELSYKLLHTLRNSGTRNQFIFVTHSPDIITASLEHSVVFVAPPKSDKSNQAILMREDDETNEALNRIGQSIGIVSLGRRIVLVEGSHTSLDKQTYGAILKNRFPSLVLAPSGGRGLIQSFNAVVEQVLNKTLWGVKFFMLCDRDALPPGKAAAAVQAKAGEKLKLLSRYHLENYFLDESILAAVFADWEPPQSWLRSAAAIRDELKNISASAVPYTTALLIAARYREQFGNLDLMARGCDGKPLGELSALILAKVAAETSRFSTAVNTAELEKDIAATYQQVQNSLDDDSWKAIVPGKAILERFASKANVPSARLKLRFLAESERASANPFQEILDIFEGFAKA